MKQNRSLTFLEVITLVSLVFFWPLGVLLLLLSSTWTIPEKVIGIVVPAGGLYAPLIFGPHLGPQFLRTVGFVLLAVAAIGVPVWLATKARHHVMPTSS